MIELKKCPFCGGEASIVYYGNVKFATVRCNECGACGPYLNRLNEEMAVYAWNWRHEEDTE